MAKRNNIPLKQIAKLNPNLTNWKIKAKISFTNEKAKVKPFSSGTGKICRVTLEDESGKIAGISYGPLADCVALNVTHNGKYFVTGANIKKVHATNKVGHKYELQFIQNKTEFEDTSSGKIFRLDDEAVNCFESKNCKTGTNRATGGNGGDILKPTRLAEVLASQDLLDSQKFDILAVLKKTEKAEPMYNNENTQNGKSTKFYRKKITIIDETGEVVLRLASEMKKKFEEHSWSKNLVRVIAVKECAWKKKGNTVYLAAYLKDVIKEEKLTMPAIKSRIKELKSWYYGKKKKATKDSVYKGNKSKTETTINNQSVMKASCSSTSQPVDKKGDFSQPGEKKNRTESLESESEKLDSRGATKMINSGVAGKKRKNPRCSTSKGRPQQGAKLRKTDDNSGPYIYNEIIHEMQVDKGIGCIQFTMSNSCGTGFRVGSKYIITAFHVMEDILIPFWEQAHKFLSVKERKEIKWTKDTLPVAGCWNLSKLFSSLDPIKRETLLKRGKEMITDSCLIEMDFKKITRGTLLKFSNDPVTFACKKNDVVILELAEQQVLPKPLILTDYSIPGTNLHVLGHPDKKVLQYDPECRIVDNKAELSEIVEKGIGYFTENGFDSQEVKEDYAPCKLSRDHILFHCSKTTAHGASGSPLVVITDKARVLGMLQTGHPKLYYNYSRNKPLEDHPELLVECGISMNKVKSLLDSHSLFQLSNELFSQELCSQVAQDVGSLTLS